MRSNRLLYGSREEALIAFADNVLGILAADGSRSDGERLRRIVDAAIERGLATQRADVRAGRRLRIPSDWQSPDGTDET